MVNYKLLGAFITALCLLLLSLAPRLNAAVTNRLLLRPHTLTYDSAELTVLASHCRSEQLTFNNQRGQPLNAWFFQKTTGPTEADAVIFYLMGRDADIASRAKLLTQIVKSGSSAFIFEYSGFGLSGGRASLTQMFSDSQCALEFLTHELGVDLDQTIFFGESLGCAIAVSLAQSYRPAGLILKSGFSELSRVMREHHPLLKLVPASLLSSKRLRVRENLRSVQLPVLIAHGLNDRIISCHHALDLYRTAAGNTSAMADLLLLKESRHAYMSDHDSNVFTLRLASFTRKARLVRQLETANLHYAAAEQLNVPTDVLVELRDSVVALTCELNKARDLPT
jgi:alpha-beta hydrolase superfamily lysophospholipase